MLLQNYFPRLFHMHAALLKSKRFLEMRWTTVLMITSMPASSPAISAKGTRLLHLTSFWNAKNHYPLYIPHTLLLVVP